MRLSLALLTATLALAVAAPAQALPTDPPIVALTPADGAVLPANPDGIRVSFACPPYTIAIYETRTDYGDVKNYVARFSRSPTLGSDGRLATRSFGADAGVGASGPGICTGKLDTFDTANSPEIVGGRVYWQAYRYCNDCPGDLEAGPVRSFVVRPNVRGSLTLPERLYPGYPGMFRFASTAPLAGATVALQRRGGERWLTVGEAPFRELTRLVATLPSGRQRVRVRIKTAAASFDLAERTVTVRGTGARSTFASDDGDYRARIPTDSTLRFRITGAGRMLRDLRASVRTSCVDKTTGRSRTVVARAVVRSARVAPDGSVTGLATASGGTRILLDGYLRDARYQGSVEILSATCAGSRRIDAERRTGS